MRISGIESHANWEISSPKNNGLHKGLEKAATARGGESGEATDAAQKQPGVLRLLQEGHFKGVTDVRLRINFHEELSAMQTAANQQSTGGAIDELSASIGAAIGALSEGQTLTEEQQQALADLQATFGQAVADAQTGYAADGDGAGLQGDLQTAFDNLLGGLQTLLAPPQDGAAAPPEETGDLLPTEPPIEPLADTEPLVEDGGTGDLAAPSPLDALRDAFATALENVAASLTPVSLLPPLSPPSGNGAAYEKFLAIYNSLQAPASPEEGTLNYEA